MVDKFTIIFLTLVKGMVLMAYNTYQGIKRGLNIVIDPSPQRLRTVAQDLQVRTLTPSQIQQEAWNMVGTAMQQSTSRLSKK